MSVSHHGFNAGDCYVPIQIAAGKKPRSSSNAYEARGAFMLHAQVIRLTMGRPCRHAIAHYGMLPTPFQDRPRAVRAILILALPGGQNFLPVLQIGMGIVIEKLGAISNVMVLFTRASGRWLIGWWGM